MQRANWARNLIGLAKRLPFAGAVIEAIRIHLDARRLEPLGGAKEVFRHHYEVNEWGSPESVSGPGSTMQYTENIRGEIPVLARALGVKTILDVPCGDYNWMRHVTWEPEVDYIGGDIVEALVGRNQALHGRRNREFRYLDLRHDALPHADLMLCRDCLIHLSDHDICAALDNFLRSDIRYLLTTTYIATTKNYDIPTGSVRLLNLELPPFAFARPAKLIDDWIPGFPVRHLGLWERHAISGALLANKEYERALSDRRST